MPAMPALSPRITTLMAVSTPSMARTLESIPPSENSARQTAITTGSSSAKMNGGWITWPSNRTRTSNGHRNITSPVSEATVSTVAERRRTGMATRDGPPRVVRTESAGLVVLIGQPRPRRPGRR